MKKVFLLLTIICTVFSSYVYSSEPIKYVKTVGEAYIRSDSTTGAEPIMTAKPGTVLEITSKAYDWFKVKLPQSAYGYVYAKYIGEDSTCSARNLNMRLKPALGAPVIGQVHGGDKVVIIAKVNSWYKVVAYPYAKGWINAKMLENLNEAELKKYQSEIKALSIAKVETPQNVIKSTTKIITKDTAKESKQEAKQEITPAIKEKTIKITPKVPDVVKLKKEAQTTIVKPSIVYKTKKKQVIQHKKVVSKVKKVDDFEDIDLDKLIKKHERVKQMISNKIGDDYLPESVYSETKQEFAVPEPVISNKAEDKPPLIEGILKKARRTATPARYKLVYNDGFDLLEITDPSKIKPLLNKKVSIWGIKKEKSGYNYITVTKIKKIK